VNVLLTAHRLLDDKRLLRAAWQQSRDAFRSNASLSLDDPRVSFGIKQAESIAKILRENVVQGKSVGGNIYSTFPYYILNRPS
jgi:complex III assembly factor LYRM7